MMPQAAYAAETLSVQVSAREGITTVGNKQSAYDNVAISHVSNYVNIRSEANTSSSIVGKIYNNCAATILATVDGEGGTWYQIQSGSVKGYIKSEYFITGAEAEKIAKNDGNCICHSQRGRFKSPRTAEYEQRGPHNTFQRFRISGSEGRRRFYRDPGR